MPFLGSNVTLFTSVLSSFSISEGAIPGLRFTKPRALSDSSRGGKDLFFENPDTATHEGYYHCEANNDAGTAKSQVIFVSENPRELPETVDL